MALAALRAGVELDEVARREVEDRSVAHLVRLCVRRNRCQLSAGPLVARRDARRAREQVHRLRERNGGDEAEGCDAVHPPLHEVRVGGRVAGHTEPTESLSDGPTERRPDFERRVRFRNTERLEQESRQGEKEEDAQERPVADHVQTTAVLAFGPVRAPVTEPKRPLNSALVGHDHEPDDQGGAEDGGPDEEDEETVEDQEVPSPRHGVTPLDPRMGEDDNRCSSKANERSIELEGPATPQTKIAVETAIRKYQKTISQVESPANVERVGVKTASRALLRPRRDRRRRRSARC